MPVPAIVGVGAAIGGAIAGVGKNKTPIATHQTDTNAYLYNGSVNGMANAENRYQGMGQASADRTQQLGGDAADAAYRTGVGLEGSFTQRGQANAAQTQGMASAAANRSAPMFNLAQANRAAAQANDARNLGLGARGSQADALAMQRQAALGQTPSVAQLQMRQGMDDAIRSQQALAASARGPAGLAMAQSQAAGNIAATQQQAAAQGGILRAQEMAQARGDYMQGASGIRQGDVGLQGADMQQQQIYSRQAQSQAELEAQQRALNQQAQMGFTQMGMENQRAYDAMAGQYGMQGLEFGQQAQLNYNTVGMQDQRAYEGMAANVAQNQMQAQIMRDQAQAGAVQSYNQFAQRQGEQNAAVDLKMFQGAVGAAEGGFQADAATGGGGKGSDVSSPGKLQGAAVDQAGGVGYGMAGSLPSVGSGGAVGGW